MAHNDIKALNDNDEKAFKNFITARENPNLKITYYFDKSESTHEEFVIFNYYYKEKSDVEDEKKKFTVQKFKNCYFKCLILRYLVPTNRTLFKGHNYVTKFRFQRYTYLNKSIFTTASSQRQRLLSYHNDDNDNVVFSFDRF